MSETAPLKPRFNLGVSRALRDQYAGYVARNPVTSQEMNFQRSGLYEDYDIVFFNYDEFYMQEVQNGPALFWLTCNSSDPEGFRDAEAHGDALAEAAKFVEKEGETWLEFDKEILQPTPGTFYGVYVNTVEEALHWVRTVFLVKPVAEWPKDYNKPVG